VSHKTNILGRELVLELRDVLLGVMNNRLGLVSLLNSVLALVVFLLKLKELE
jgi:hypothetical protein